MKEHERRIAGGWARERPSAKAASALSGAPSAALPELLLASSRRVCQDVIRESAVTLLVPCDAAAEVVHLRLGEAQRILERLPVVRRAALQVREQIAFLAPLLTVKAE